MEFVIEESNCEKKVLKGRSDPNICVRYFLGIIVKLHKNRGKCKNSGFVQSS